MARLEIRPDQTLLIDLDHREQEMLGHLLGEPRLESLEIELSQLWRLTDPKPVSTEEPGAPRIYQAQIRAILHA